MNTNTQTKIRHTSHTKNADNKHTNKPRQNNNIHNKQPTTTDQPTQQALTLPKPSTKRTNIHISKHTRNRNLQQQQTGTWTIGNLNNGQTATLTITATVTNIKHHNKHSKTTNKRPIRLELQQQRTTNIHKRITKKRRTPKSSF